MLAFVIFSIGTSITCGLCSIRINMLKDFAMSLLLAFLLLNLGIVSCFLEILVVCICLVLVLSFLLNLEFWDGS